MLDVCQIGRCSGHRAAIYGLAPGRDAGHFLTGGGDGWLVEWNLAAPETGQLLANVGENRIFSLCRLPENRVVVGTMTGGVHWLDLDEPERTRNIQHHTKGVFEILAVGPWVFTAGGDGCLTRWDAAAARPLETLKLSNQSLRCLAYAKTRGELAVGASDGAIYFLDFQTLALKGKIEAAHLPSVFALAWSTGEAKLWSGGRDAQLKVWDAEQGFALAKNISAHWYTLNNMVCSPDGRLVATASRDRTVKIWDEASAELLKVLDSQKLSGHTASVNRLLWLPGGLVSASDDRTALIWQIGGL